MPQIPARFPSGVSTQPYNAIFGNLPVPNPFDCNFYFNDFNTYAAGDWTVTTVNGGTSALQALNGGSLLLTTGATGTNFQGNTLNPASFAITGGYQAWFLANITVADIASANSPSFVLGLTNGGPSAPTDGVYFTKASGANQKVSAVIRASSTSTTITNIATLTDATAVSLGWYYDGKAVPTIYFFSSSVSPTQSALGQQNNIGGLVVTSASSDPAATNSLVNIPVAATVMAPQIYMVTPNAFAKTIAVDFIGAACEINRF
jgi:hypothetical protein